MKKTILILDDNSSIAKIIAMYLSSEYEFHYFNNPILGIRWMQEGNIPDLIITDIYMPEMKGTDFLYYIKNNELYKNIPVIVLSGEESSNIRIKLLEDGADDFILKPFNPLELKVRIKKALR